MSRQNKQEGPRGEQGGVSSSRTEGATRIVSKKAYGRKGDGIKASGLEDKSNSNLSKSMNEHKSKASLFNDPFFKSYGGSVNESKKKNSGMWYEDDYEDSSEDE